MGWLPPRPLRWVLYSRWVYLERPARGLRPRQVQGACPLDHLVIREVRLDRPDHPVTREVHLDRPGYRQEDHPVFLGLLAPWAGPRVA